MKKIIKRLAIALSLTIFLAVLAIGFDVWIVFTPEKLTPIVRRQMPKYITCQSEIGEVELTFFSTFPRFGLKVNRFLLINPTSTAPSDTLVYAGELVGIIDVWAWWKRNEIVLKELHLNDGTINTFVDSLGHSNYDVIKADTAAVLDTARSTVSFSYIDMQDVTLKDINLSYSDKVQKIEAGITGLSAKISGSMISDTVLTHIRMSDGLVSVCYDGECYLRNASIKFNLPVLAILSRQFIKINPAEFSVNGLNTRLSGTVENDTLKKAMITNIKYAFSNWDISDMLALTPRSYQGYLKGIVADGLVSSDGNIVGNYSDSSMPLLDIHLKIENGTVKYPEFPLPLSHINGDMVFYSDLEHDAISYLHINRFSAKTPHSSFNTAGRVTHLLSDIHCDLNSSANLVLAEFVPLIPAEMKVKMDGTVSGSVRSAFSISQVEKLQLDKMRISGSMEFSNLHAVYDSISLNTDYAKADFALPNPGKSKVDAHFASVKLSTRSLQAIKLNTYSAFLHNALISMETSDFRDTTRIPIVACTFDLDSLSAGMDTFKVAVQKPAGQFTMLPQKDKLMSPNIHATFSCGELAAAMGLSAAYMNRVQLTAGIEDDPARPEIMLAYSGENLALNMEGNSASIDKIDLKADIINDKTQKDVFQQWLVNGFLEMNRGVISMSSIRYPVEIPSIKMYFTPEELNIKESSMKIDHSDFSLSGTLSNFISHFRSDSLLWGDFTFVSNSTDVLQLMSLTSGMGEQEAKPETKPAEKKDSTAYSGPYMVPKGMDITLHTNIREATLDDDTITAITGDIFVKDGLLVLDKLLFTTPASKMQLTAMYRTPRRNHLFLGIDYHMLNVEIEQLLQMIPDIDTIMPMLRSFRGKGEFHMAGEIYLDSLYNPKKSTIRVSSSIRGQDLVLMDGSTFSEIAKKLKFKKQTRNKVDSLSVEFTVFKQEIDIYPFLIVMDKYKAIVEGRHNFDMTFNYNISLVQCPLPVRLGLDIAGNMENLKYHPRRCKYDELYRPTARGAVQNRQLELRKMIRDALTQNVVKQ